MLKIFNKRGGLRDEPIYLWNVYDHNGYCLSTLDEYKAGYGQFIPNLANLTDALDKHKGFVFLWPGDEETGARSALYHLGYIMTERNKGMEVYVRDI